MDTTAPLIHKSRSLKFTPLTPLYVLRGILFIILLLLVSATFFVTTLIVWLLSKAKILSAGRAAVFMCNCAALTMSVFMVNVLERIMGVKLEFSGDPLPKAENAIVISNHVTNMDVFCILAYQYRLGMCGHGKFMSKEALKHVPFFGWACNMMGQVFLKRNWDQDKQKITQTFDFLCSNQLPVHLVVFCEGTRINAKNRKEALEFAQQKGIEPMEQVNFPRSRGFKAVANHMRESHIKYVYDFTIGYLDGTIRFRDLILSSVWGSKVLINVKRIPLSRVPQGDTEIHEWLMDRFRRKDKLIKEMRKNRRFEGEKVLDVPMNFVL